MSNASSDCSASPLPPSKPLRALWLHTQPEHYFNLMIDDLNASNPDIEYIAAFTYKGEGNYTEMPLPKSSRSIILTPLPQVAGRAPGPWGRYHQNWQAEIEALDPHIVFVAGYSGQTQRQILDWCTQRGIPTAMWSDSNIRGQRGKSCKKRIFRQVKKQFLQPLIASVDYFLTANSRGEAYWRYFGVPREKIVVCPCYADYGRIASASKITREQAFERYHFDPQRKLILSMARLVPAKSLDLAINAFKESGLAEKGWIYAIAGTGPLEHKLKALAGAHLNRSIFMLGFCQPAEILPLLGHADLCLLPSNYEPHGIVIQEAAAAGTPCITSDACGAAHDLINPGLSGWLFRSGHKESLIQILDMATQNAALLPAMRSHARASFEAYFAAKSPISIINQISRDLLLQIQLLDPDTHKPRIIPAGQSQNNPLRIAICQPLIPLYRVPVFNLLGQQPGIRLTVLGGHSQGSLQAVSKGKYFHTDLAPVNVLPLLLRNFVTQSAQLEVLDRKRFDLAIIPWDIHYLSMFRAIHRARKIGMPIILWGHGYSKQMSHRRFDAVRNWVGRRASGVLLYTRTVAQRLIDQHQFDPAKVFVATNALDQRPIQAARQSWLARPTELAEFQKQHGISPNRTIIFVSRLERTNRMDLLLQAVALLRQAKRDVNAVLIGKGPEEPHLRTLARQLKITDSILFPGAIYKENELAPWMLSAGVFCYPEEIGLSILHAFGYGLPVVTSDNIAGQNPEVEAFIDGQTGYFYPHGNVQEMARFCGEILADATLRQNLGFAARKQVLERYTLPNMVQGFLDATSVVDGQKRRLQLPANYTPPVFSTDNP